MQISTDLNNRVTYFTNKLSTRTMGFLIKLDGVAQDLTGKVTTINIRKYEHSAVLYTDTCVNSDQTTDTGLCTFTLTPAIIEDFDYGNYVFEVITTLNSLQVQAIRGIINVK